MKYNVYYLVFIKENFFHYKKKVKKQKNSIWVISYDRKLGIYKKQKILFGS